jgi:hypothetical protein
MHFVDLQFMLCLCNPQNEECCRKNERIGDASVVLSNSYHHPRIVTLHSNIFFFSFFSFLSFISQDALKSKAWRDSLLSQIVEQVQAELAPILSQKVRETVKDTVR